MEGMHLFSLIHCISSINNIYLNLNACIIFLLGTVYLSCFDIHDTMSRIQNIEHNADPVILLYIGHHIRYLQT